MPLSEHEQRLLEQMEKALYAEDPQFATALRANRGGAQRGRAVMGVLAFLAGMGLILAGVATTVVALGVVGFAVMLVGAVLVYSAFTAPRPLSEEGAEQPAPTKPTSSHQGPGFMDKLEERWRRRAEGDPSA